MIGSSVFLIKALAYSGFIISQFTRRERGWKFLRSTLHIFLDLNGSFCSGIDAGTTATEQKAETRTQKCFLAAPYGKGRPSSGDRQHCYAIYQVLGSFPFTRHCHGSSSAFPALEIASRRVGFLTSGMEFDNFITFYIKIILLLCIKITQAQKIKLH